MNLDWGSESGGDWGKKSTSGRTPEEEVILEFIPSQRGLWLLHGETVCHISNKPRQDRPGTGSTLVLGT